MKKITIQLLMAALLGVLLASCMLTQSPTMCSYTYRDVGSDKLLTGFDQVIYLPGDTVVFIPSGRKIVIVSVKIGNTTLKL